ncbi:TlpA family protein disulfide reductase [Lutibacter sp. A80]|uniref:TlpA family protein disulfide reductase n=1 Tax=Lutibacter sp. A80 TaxID=2918453 RepID=UPI001F06539B|nr:TlpA disulfide reductase family protein [Lutibacter sp. A80]UMB60834.1 TlpA family protein disulfide reductase [Lutibacter sp. A80]
MRNLKNKFIIVILSVVFMATSNAQQKENKHPNQFTIKGEIKGLTGNLYFRHPDKEYTRETPSDTLKFVNGKIQFSDTISKLTLIRAYPDFQGPDKKVFKRPKDGRGYFPVKCAYLMFYAFPGAEITIKGELSDYVNAYPSGDKFNNSLAAVNKVTFPNYNKMGNLAVQNTYETDSLIIKANNVKAEEIFNKNSEELIAHMKANPNSLGAVFYLNDMMLRRQIDDEKAEELFNDFSKDLAEYADYKNVASRIEGIKSTKEGFPVPSIKTTATLNGKEFDINSLRGKYVLIDFWGIWCGPCVAEMPQVKEFQEKHKEKLVVLGINSGDSKEKIQAFVNKHGYEWKQLMSDEKNTPDNFVNRFNVQGFPTKFIIDPRGNIVKKYLGGGEEAFELLEELLNK